MRQGRRGVGVVLVEVRLGGQSGFSERTVPNGQVNARAAAVGVVEAVRHWWQVSRARGV
ncbi:hypothetical protein GCM10008019_32650 [Deinococcus soli (ex Cha et al. 2016)]|nr:hypothetical protein GCM10008019_32650 [Deinococcus soli (ex Cha et al. 2016)]